MYEIKYLNWKVSDEFFEEKPAQKIVGNKEAIRTTKILIRVEYFMLFVYFVSAVIVLISGNYSTGLGIFLNVVLAAFILLWCVTRLAMVVELKKKLKVAKDNLDKPVVCEFKDLIQTIWLNEIESIVVYHNCISIMAKGWDDILTVETDRVVVREEEVNAITITESGIFIGNQDSVGKSNTETKGVEIELSISR